MPDGHTRRAIVRLLLESGSITADFTQLAHGRGGQIVVGVVELGAAVRPSATG
ncbi:hypothetical protein MAHJHV57_52130 [Mycobacterium avium subsp. hominissuis]